MYKRILFCGLEIFIHVLFFIIINIIINMKSLLFKKRLGENQSVIEPELFKCYGLSQPQSRAWDVKCMIVYYYN